MATFSSNEYGWNDISVSFGGRTLMTCTGISYKDKVESELIYGKGGDPIGVQDGNRSLEGNLKCHQSEFDRIVASGDKGVKALKNLTIQWAFEKDGRISTRVFDNVRITEIGEDYKQGDKTAEVEFPFIFTGLNIF